ncbi:MAG TPA: PstS family phosphate ABC transporter substrate-binding protein [Chloroflexota bacterium]
MIRRRFGRGWYLATALMASAGLVLGACATSGQPSTQQPSTGSGLSGTVAIDGSSTVFPITEAVAEEFQKRHPDVKVPVGVSGTGGGFKKFCAKETDISNASRPISESEVAACQQSGVAFIELPVAFDGLSVVVNKENTWVDHLTVEELKKLWEPAAQGTVTRWSQVRPGWPDEPIRLFGPGTDSGTFDYFTAAINGEEGASRGDYTASEDDNVLVQGVSGDKFALGYFGYAYYVENQDKLKLVPIVNPQTGQPVLPSEETINNGSYAPLSRPIFIYVSVAAAERPEVREFVRFYLTEGPKLASEVGYVPLPQRAYELALARFDARKTGSVFAGGSQPGLTVEEVLARES